MRVLHLYCHPLADSFHGALKERVRAGLVRAGHEVDLLDLYAERFDPVMDAAERRRYHDVTVNRQGLEPVIARLERAEALVVQFPTWCFGPPAMLKGFLDRVLMPGVGFDLSDPAHARPLLQQIRHVRGVVTYGRPRWAAWYMGDPPRKLVTRYLKWFTAPKAAVGFHALYHMNVAGPAERQRFLAKVEQAMAGL